LDARKKEIQPINLFAAQGTTLPAPIGHCLSDDRHDLLGETRPALFERRGQELHESRALAAWDPQIA
jgi:hypothetical protein